MKHGEKLIKDGKPLKNVISLDSDSSNRGVKKQSSLHDSINKIDHQNNLINIWNEFPDNIEIEPMQNPLEGKATAKEENAFEIDDAGWKEYLNADFVKGRH